MPRKPRKRKEPTQEQQQPYDSLLKSLLEGHERELLPYFFSEAIYLDTLDIEVHRTTLRVDRVYKILYEGQEHILHLEFESGPDDDMDRRLLDYHAYLYRKYGLPVISVIIYPFRTTMATSPLRELSGAREILTFHFHVLPLWQLRAEQYVHAHEVLMYALLPAMEGANATLLGKAIDEMIEYYQGKEAQLGQELRWLGIILRRADIVPLEDKQVIEERLNMYDDLIERDPKMQRIRAESRAQGIAEGEARGELKGRAEGLQEALVTTVRVRFPSLTDLAQRKVKRVKKPEALTLLLEQVTAAPDENAARIVLSLVAA